MKTIFMSGMMLIFSSSVFAQQEDAIGSWTVVPNSVLVVKEINGKKWLLQTTTGRDYYVVRGKNMLDRNDVKLTKKIDKEQLENEVTGIAGLMPSTAGESLPGNWPDSWWADQGYAQNKQGEFVKFENNQAADEEIVGSWSVVPNSVLVIKTINGKKWLLQTTKNRDYYVVRGKNMLGRSDVKLIKKIDTDELENESTGIAGLMPSSAGESLPTAWPASWWSGQGYAQNKQGEFVKSLTGGTSGGTTGGTSGGTTGGTTGGTSGGTTGGTSGGTTGGTTGGITGGNGSFSLPVGAIRWDAWGKSTFDMSDPNTYSDITQFTRAALGNDRFRHLIPFFGKITESQTMNLPYQNTTNPPSRFYQMQTYVEFNGNSQEVMDKEIEYAKYSGLDYWIFCYYPDFTSLAYARKLFISSQNKQGFKMAYRLESLGSSDVVLTEHVDVDSLANEVTPQEGLYPSVNGGVPSGWPMEWWTARGYRANEAEMVDGKADTSNEVIIGTWKIVPDSLLIVKTINGKKWLLQTNQKREYYVPRGKNFVEGPLRREVSLDHIAWAMKQDFYQKIDGKPVIYVVNGYEKDLAVLKSKYGGDLYSLYMPIKAYAPGDLPIIYQHGMNGVSWYASWSGSADKKHRSIMAEDAMIRDSFLKTSTVDIGPVMTVSMTNESIVHTKDNSDKNSYFEAATDAENEEQLESIISFAKANSGRVKTIVVYAWNENAESGKPIVPTLNKDGSINKNVIELFRKHLE